MSERSLKRSGQLVAITEVETVRGHFRLLGRFEAESRAADYARLRIVSDPYGLLGEEQAPTTLLQWETLFDRFITRRGAVIALCQFDARRFSGDSILTLLSTHPLCIVGDKLISNPFYLPPETYALTRREIQVLQAVAFGQSDKEIAQTLGLSIRTVQNHVAGILNKMAVRSRAAAGAQAVREGIVE